MGLLVLASGIALGAETAMDGTVADPELPSVGLSLVRVLGALALVLMVFAGGVWLVRHWRRLAPGAVAAPDLRVLEVKSLGVRQSLMVVGYRKQRLLLATAPTGVTLLTHLAEADADEESGVPRPDFAGAFQEVLGRRA